MSDALYLRDPDENGVNLYWNRPIEARPRTPDGELAMLTNPLDLESLLVVTEKGWSKAAANKSIADGWRFRNDLRSIVTQTRN